MFRTRYSFALIGFALIATPAIAAEGTADKCAAMNYLLAQARTDFPDLAHYKMKPGRCALLRDEFKCEWAFTGDRYTAAKEQAAQLVECTASQRGAKPIEGKRDESRYQLNPETSVSIRGPQMDSGDWKLTLKIVSTADWN